MRRIYVVLTALVLIVLGATFALERGPDVPAIPVEAAAQASSAAAPAAQVLACIENALGGTTAFSGVSSLRITGDTKPAATTGPRPLPGTRQISVTFPNRYKRVDTGLRATPGVGGMSSIVGFDGGRVLNTPRLGDDATAMRSARTDFARQMLMRLPREAAGVTLSASVGAGLDRDHLIIAAFGPGDSRARLIADRRTCVPVAFEYERPGPVVMRVDLSGYREFHGIQFPTVLKTAKNGKPFAEERVSDVQVNAPDAQTYFSGSR